MLFISNKERKTFYKGILRLFIKDLYYSRLVYKLL